MRPRRAITKICMLVAATCVALPGCTQSDRAPEWTGSIDTLDNGAIRIQNGATGLWDEASSWQTRETCRIGGVDGEGPEQFSQIVGLVRDAAGRIYILDRQAQELRQFAADGRFLRTLGRPGAGPGEFRRANGVLATPDGGSIVVPDPGNARYHVFDTAGTYQRHYVRPITSYGYISDATFTADGNLIEGGNRAIPQAGERPEFRAVLIRMSLDSILTIRDTIDLPHRDAETFTIDRVENGRLMGQSIWLIPFSAGISTTVDPRGFVWVAQTDQYRIWQQSFDGDSVRVIERVAERAPVTGTERENAIAPIREDLNGAGEPDWSRIPDFKPYFRQLVVDGLGHLWVRRFTAGGTTVFDVFDEQGRFLGSLDTGVAIGEWTPLAIGATAITAVTVDEFDVPTVVCLAIDGRAVPGPGR